MNWQVPIAGAMASYTRIGRIGIVDLGCKMVEAGATEQIPADMRATEQSPGDMGATEQISGDMGATEHISGDMRATDPLEVYIVVRGKIVELVTFVQHGEPGLQAVGLAGSVFGEFLLRV